MDPLVSDLENTPSATWLRQLGKTATRETYYRALRTVLTRDSADPGRKPARVELDGLTGHQSSSTMYNALKRNSLIAALRPSEFRDRLHDGDIVDRLIAEAKIWSYRCYRRGWIKGLSRVSGGPVRLGSTTLLRTLALWAAEEPALAAADGYAPPHIAVQDLCVVVGQHPLTEQESTLLLTQVAETAGGPLGVSPDAVVDAVYDQLMTVAYERPTSIRRSFEYLRESLRDMLHVLERMPEEDAAEALPPGVSPEILRQLAEGA